MRKEVIANHITDLIGVTPVVFSRGSTEPKEFFVQVIEALGLDAEKDFTKPELARLIVESSGNIWLDSYESNGSTITRDGLLAVKNAVEFFLGK